MDEYILAELQDRIAPADAARLSAWRRAAPANEARYQQLAQLWRVTNRPDPWLPASHPPALGAILDRRKTLRRRYALTGLAAAAVIILAVGQFWRGPGAVPSSNPAGLGAAEFITEIEELATARLDDGSMVRLAPKSRLRVSPTRARREVWLDGQAFFAVARDTARPFTVRTRIGDVEVLGTRFDVRVEGTALRLVVTEGQVALTAGGRREIVVAGQIATVTDGEAPLVIRGANPDTALTWMRGFLVFQDTPLRQAAREIERRYGIQILLPDTVVAERLVTAWFTSQEVGQVLDAVCRAVEAHCTLHNGVASIEP